MKEGLEQTVMTHQKQGFTLAELLIALAILGFIAAFTIPKLLESTRSEEGRAKVREVVATIENVFYGKKHLDKITGGYGFKYGAGNKLYQNLIDQLNVVQTGTGAVPVGNASTDILPPGHPCGAAIGTVNIHMGWMVFPTGVVVTGLESGADFDAYPWDDPSHTGANNYVLCMDYNGKANPNQPGQDVFVGNFNQYGAFGASTPADENSKNFNWGNRLTDVVDNQATPVVLGGFPDGGGKTLGDRTRNPVALAGSLFTN